MTTTPDTIPLDLSGTPWWVAVLLLIPITVGPLWLLRQAWRRTAQTIDNAPQGGPDEEDPDR